MVLKSIDQAGSRKIRARFTLKSPNERVIVDETQRFEFCGDANSRALDCEVVLYANNGPAEAYRVYAGRQ